jgi:uncharacterized protein YjbI with pentapeptide repeats
VWNARRLEAPPIRPDFRDASLRTEVLKGVNFSEANLTGADLTKADLRNADLSRAEISGASIGEADLRGADLQEAHLSGAFLGGSYLSGADLTGASLCWAKLPNADLRSATLRCADLRGALLYGANLSNANLSGATLIGADLSHATLQKAKLVRGDLRGAKLDHADLREADLRGANLQGASILEADLSDADLTGCGIYGVSAWNVTLTERTKQQDLVITPYGEPEVTVDKMEVAQFVYLLLKNEKIRDVIDTIGRKGVLLLGRFTEDRIAVLERLRAELRNRGYLPIVFNFDKPETKDFTETVRLLAGLSKFVIADLSGPKSAPYELGAIVSQTMIPFQPIITASETPFAMLRDLLTSYPDRVFQPIEYPSVDRLVETMEAEIIGPAETRFDELVMRRAETLKVRRV